MDLSTQEPDSISPPVSAGSREKSYPGFTVSDAPAKELLEQVELETEITATVKLKVTRLSQDRYGTSVGFDVLDIDNIKPAKGKSKSDEGDTAALGYKRPDSGKEAPKLSAKDLRK
jgi:hypothetical protein